MRGAMLWAYLTCLGSGGAYMWAGKPDLALLCFIIVAILHAGDVVSEAINLNRRNR